MYLFNLFENDAHEHHIRELFGCATNDGIHVVFVSLLANR